MQHALAVIEAAVWKLSNGVFPSNCYLCATDEPGQCLVVDPGLDPQPILAALAELGLTPLAVLCTHGHFDHAGSAAQLQARYACPVVMHQDDVKTLRFSNFLLMAFKIDARVTVPELTLLRGERAELVLGGRSVRFHAAPGHTPGSCLIEIGDALFTGDTLYARGVGLSRLPGEDAVRLRHSIQAALGRFADDILVCPGHGEQAPLGSIKRDNAPLLRFLRAEASEVAAS